MRAEVAKLLEDALAGSMTTDEEAMRYVMRALRRWLIGGRDGRPLAAVMGLPPSPERARTALRDAYILEAARILEPAHRGKPWSLACALHEELRSFAGHRWQCWMQFRAPPGHATPVQAALWWAMLARPDAHRLTTQRLLQIIEGYKAF